jgi:hypothetical protein
MLNIPRQIQKSISDSANLTLGSCETRLTNMPEEAYNDEMAEA